MRKLKLELDTLQVESWETEADGGRERGTVLGRALTEDCQKVVLPYTQACSGAILCTYVQTCKVTCDDRTCRETCLETHCPDTCLASCASCFAPCGTNLC